MKTLLIDAAPSLAAVAGALGVTWVCLLVLALWPSPTEQQRALREALISGINDV
jgi:hypothetical protein